MPLRTVSVASPLGNCWGDASGHAVCGIKQMSFDTY